jgi:hypothetical protein
MVAQHLEPGLEQRSAARGFGDDAVARINLAKALSSAYLPIAAVMVPEVMYEALLAESDIGPLDWVTRQGFTQA